MAAAGHGTYFLLGLASAPLSFLGIPFSLVGPPVLWGAVGGFLAYTGRQPQRQILVIVMLLHYMAVLLIPFFDVYAEAKYFDKVWRTNPLIVVMGVALYLVGQVVIWLYWFKMGRKSDSLIGS